MLVIEALINNERMNKTTLPSRAGLFSLIYDALIRKEYDIVGLCKNIGTSFVSDHVVVWTNDISYFKLTVHYDSKTVRINMGRLSSDRHTLVVFDEYDVLCKHLFGEV